MDHLIPSQGMQKLFSVLFFLIVSLIIPSTIQVNPYIGWKCMDRTQGNYTLNSTYNSNLLSAFSNLTSLSSSSTFSNVTAGAGTGDVVYALYDCRNDLTLQTCHDCVEDATTTLLQLCISKEAIITYQECVLRYANRPIFGTLELTPHLSDCAVGGVPDGGVMNRTLETLSDHLIDEATSTNSSRYFAIGNETYFVHQQVYCLVQCTPDITRESCRECLMDAQNYTLLYCASNGRFAGIRYGPSCQLRYGLGPYFNLSSNDALPPAASPTSLSNPSPQLRSNNGAHHHHWVFDEFLLFFVFVVVSCLLLSP